MQKNGHAESNGGRDLTGAQRTRTPMFAAHTWIHSTYRSYISHSNCWASHLSHFVYVCVSVYAFVVLQRRVYMLSCVLFARARAYVWVFLVMSVCGVCLFVSVCNAYTTLSISQVHRRRRHTHMWEYEHTRSQIEHRRQFKTSIRQIQTVFFYTFFTILLFLIFNSSLILLLFCLAAHCYIHTLLVLRSKISVAVAGFLQMIINGPTTRAANHSYTATTRTVRRCYAYYLNFENRQSDNCESPKIVNKK